MSKNNEIQMKFEHKLLAFPTNVEDALMTFSHSTGDFKIARYKSLADFLYL